LPLTSLRRVDLIVTELAVIEPTDEGLVLKELMPGIRLGDVQAATAARLIVGEGIPR
jgi:acetate CoA/acetoacetate CoA-transferase beta subunit